jgi:HSP20 family protein
MKRLFNDPFFSTVDIVFESVNNVLTKPRSIVDKTDNGYSLVMAVPGLSKEDLKIIIRDRKITITYENEKKDEDSYFVEKFSKSYYLSDDIIEKKIEAEVKNGVLKINLPTKDPESTEKVVDIK